MSRLPRLTFALLVTLAGACSDDGSAQPDAAVDARRDGSATCSMADCQALPRPGLYCAPPTVLQVTCVATYDGRCTWGQERCSPGADAGTESDGSAGDAGSPDAADDAAADAPQD